MVTLCMRKIVHACISLLACVGTVRAQSIHHTPYDSVHHEIFRDTVFDKSLPSVHIDLITYSNFERITVGYELVLRDTELEIQDVELYVGQRQRRLNTLSLFRLHAGDSAETNRIDRLRIWNKFPFDTITTDTDSLVVITNRGNITLYLDEVLRRRKALQEQRDVLSHSMNETVGRYRMLITILLGMAALATIIAFSISRRTKRRRDDVVNNLIMMFADSERAHKELNHTVQNLFKQKFDTLNKLCFEYFEKGESPILRKSIFKEVENEILRLREPAEISKLEESLNRYCDDIMGRVDAQLPGLSLSDRTLLVYLFSGFSARTICVLSDIEIKTFYMRRYRLKNKILASEASDRVLFAEKM